MSALIRASGAEINRSHGPPDQDVPGSYEVLVGGHFYFPPNCARSFGGILVLRALKTCFPPAARVFSFACVHDAQLFEPSLTLGPSLCHLTFLIQGYQTL